MRSTALLLLCGLTASFTGCADLYTATVQCKLCGVVLPRSGSAECTKEAAEQSAAENCTNGGGVLESDPTTYEIETVFASACPDQRSSVPNQLRPTLETAAVLNAGKRIAQKRRITTADGPSCPKPGVTFTVIARNQNQDDDAPCDDAREVRVVYEKYVGEFEVPEEVTLSAVISVGGSHTFTVTDAYPSEDGSAQYFYVIYQLYTFIPNEVCEPVPFEEGGMSRGFSQELREGGTLDITYLPIGSGSTFDYTITNPTRAGQVAIKPIPDPKFARGR